MKCSFAKIRVINVFVCLFVFNLTKENAVKSRSLGNIISL